MLTECLKNRSNSPELNLPLELKGLIISDIYRDPLKKILSGKYLPLDMRLDIIMKI